MVEPLALRMERLLEAPEVHSCRFISFVFLMDPWQAPTVFFRVDDLFS
jgi:hypothetical protein